jgi:nucleoside transporter
MNSPYRLRLFVMMFLEFFIWGAWFLKVFGYLPHLGFDQLQQAVILNAFPVSAIVAMFFSNQFADRNFAAEKFLAFSHLIGGLAMFGLAWTTSFWPFLGLMLVHCLFYVPTISITNSIAFAAMKDPKHEFGWIRMGGTIGWIAASWPAIFLIKDVASTRWTYIVTGIASLVLAGFSLALPHTPPKRGEGVEPLAWLKALRLLGVPFILVLWLVTFVDAAVHQAFFSWVDRFLINKVGIPDQWTMAITSISQFAEIFTMAILGVFLTRLGWKTTMILGILGHALRFAVFAYFPDIKWLVIGINVVHGICYAFFFATVYIFVDEYLPKDIRASAQGLFNLMILGIGQWVANFICPYLYDTVFTSDGVVDYKSLMLVPCVTAIAAALALAIFFWPPAHPPNNTNR